MPRSRDWSIRWDNPGKRGMWQMADPRQVKDPFVQWAMNADFRKLEGAIRKTPGFGLHALGILPGTIPLPKIISIGLFPYIKVWESDEQVNKRKLRVYVQVVSSSVFKYYFREYDYTTQTWGGWFYWRVNPGDPPIYLFQTLDYGTSSPDRVRWLMLPDMALRGSGGAQYLANPLWVGYINRMAVDDRGYFHDYLFGNSNVDLREHAGVMISNSLPEIIAGLYFFDDYGNLLADAWSPGYFHDETVLICVVPVFDDYQIGSNALIKSESAPADHYRFYEVSTPGTEYNVAFRFKLRLDWDTGTLPVPPYRLSGFRIYQARKPFPEAATPTSYAGWQLVKDIDIREGNPIALFAATGVYRYTGGEYIMEFGFGQVNSAFSHNVYNDCLLAITVNNVKKYFVITNTEGRSGDNVVWIHFTPVGTTGLVDGNTYNAEIYERWKDEGNGYFIVPVVIDGLAVGEAGPEYLPNPDRIADATYKAPLVQWGYRRQILYNDRLTVGDCFDTRDEVRYPLMVRQSNQRLDPAAGFDILCQQFMIPSHAGDRVMGFSEILNTLQVYTEEKIFRVRNEPLLTIQQEPFTVGLASSDSLVQINGKDWFFGKEGARFSFFQSDGVHEPVDIGKRIQDIIDAAMADPQFVLSAVQAWHDKRTRQYMAALNRYNLPSVPGGTQYTVCDKNVTESNRNFQKQAHFRPNTNEIWVCVVDRPNTGAPWRKWFNGGGSASLDLVNMGGTGGEWVLSEDEESGYLPTVSWLFSDDGATLYAVTTLRAGSRYLVVKKCNLDTMTWTQLMITSAPSTAEFNNPDIVLDGRGLPVAVYQLYNYPVGTHRIYVRYYTADLTVVSVRINEEGSLIPNGKVSIVLDDRIPSAKKIYIHACNESDNSTYLYRIDMSAEGVPLIPPEGAWQHIAEPNMPNSHMALGENGIGIVGKDPSDVNKLIFKLWDGETLSDAEDVINPLALWTTDVDSFGLAFRDATWQVLMTPVTPTEETNFVKRFRRLSDGTWEFADQANTGHSLIDHYGIIADKVNPVGIPPNTFGALVVAESPNPTAYPVLFVLFGSLTGELDMPVYEQGLVGATLIGIDVDNFATHVYSSFSDYLKVADAVEIEGRLVFSDGDRFEYFWDNFTDHSSLGYLNRVIELETGAEDAGLYELKLAHTITLDFDLASGDWVNVIIYNDLGETVEFVGDPSTGAGGFGLEQRGVPQDFHLEGRAFHIKIWNQSGTFCDIRAAKLEGSFWGGNS